MVLDRSQEQERLRAEVRTLCAQFGNEYWRALDRRRAYPEEFVRALTEAGYLSVLVPKPYGGRGLGITEASIILEEVNRSGGSSAACHAQLYLLSALVRHATEAQKQRWLPPIASGEARLQSFSVTEPEAGSDTTAIQTTAVRDGNLFVVNGHKNWTSRIQQSDLLLLLARTEPRETVTDRTHGLSLFLVDLREAREQQPARSMCARSGSCSTTRPTRLPTGTYASQPKT